MDVPTDACSEAGEPTAVPEPSAVTGLGSPDTADTQEAVMETVALESEAAAPACDAALITVPSPVVTSAYTDIYQVL